MNIAAISIKRPAFITSVMLIIIIVGLICFKKMRVDLFPDIEIPTIFISTIYTGAAPSEIEQLITRPIEEKVSTIAGIKRVNSRSMKDSSQVVINFLQGTDMRYAEQQVRDKLNQVRNLLPDEIQEPTIRKIDPSDQPIMTISVEANLPENELFDLADQIISPRLEQANNVGMTEILGARKREIHVLLDQQKLKNHDISLSEVRAQLANSGENVPIGKNNIGSQEMVFRSSSEFSNLKQIEDLIVNFYSNEVPTKISHLGKVEDGLVDEKSRVFSSGKKSIFIDIYRQSDSNIIAVAKGIEEQIEKITPELKRMNGSPQIKIIKNASKYIKNNVYDVYETIAIAIILTIITVFFFLGNGRATIITAISLPISLIGVFAAMYVANFSINVVSLLALSLSVGLLVDDAIVVVENIYRKIEEGVAPSLAAIQASREIAMAVIAITLVIVSVFTPISFMKGIVGQYLRQFGLTIAFAMLISLLVALSIIPMLCAYLSGTTNNKNPTIVKNFFLQKIVKKFDQFQKYLEEKYEKILNFSISHPKKIIGATLIIMALSLFTFKFVPKTFNAESNNGEISISLELQAESSLENTSLVAQKIDEIIRTQNEVEFVSYLVGSYSGQSNRANYYVRLKKERDITTSQFKQNLRQKLKDYQFANPIIRDYDPTNSGSRGSPFNLTLISPNQNLLENYAAKLFEDLKSDPRLKDVDISNKTTRQEFRVLIKEEAAKIYGINSQKIGDELRGYIEGYVPTKFRQNGLEYDVRVRLAENQRNLKENFSQLYVPNLNKKLILLSDVATTAEGKEAAVITRQDHGRYIQISANLASGVGLGNVIQDTIAKFEDPKSKLPSEIRYSFVGDSENMQEMLDSMSFALLIAVIFIYLILTSLYESFVTPFTILLALPLALCGTSFALFAANESMNIFTILGIFLLIGVSGKNSILLIDFTNQLIAQGKTRREALIEAGKVRLRPILMTSFALIFGTLPVAIGLNESSSQRTAMGIAIIGGLISSTFLTLIVVPAVFSYIDRFRLWTKSNLQKFIN